MTLRDTETPFTQPGGRDFAREWARTILGLQRLCAEEEVDPDRALEAWSILVEDAGNLETGDIDGLVRALAAGGAPEADGSITQAVAIAHEMRIASTGSLVSGAAAAARLGRFDESVMWLADAFGVSAGAARSPGAERQIREIIAGLDATSIFHLVEGLIDMDVPLGPSLIEFIEALLADEGRADLINTLALRSRVPQMVGKRDVVGARSDAQDDLVALSRVASAPRVPLDETARAKMRRALLQVLDELNSEFGPPLDAEVARSLLVSASLTLPDAVPRLTQVDMDWSAVSLDDVTGCIRVMRRALGDDSEELIAALHSLGLCGLLSLDMMGELRRNVPSEQASALALWLFARVESLPSNAEDVDTEWLHLYKALVIEGPKSPTLRIRAVTLIESGLSPSVAQCFSAREAEALGKALAAHAGTSQLVSLLRHPSQLLASTWSDPGLEEFRGSLATGFLTSATTDSRWARLKRLLCEWGSEYNVRLKGTDVELLALHLADSRRPGTPDWPATGARAPLKADARLTVDDALTCAAGLVVARLLELGRLHEIDSKDFLALLRTSMMAELSNVEAWGTRLAAAMQGSEARSHYKVWLLELTETGHNRELALGLPSGLLLPWLQEVRYRAQSVDGATRLDGRNAVVAAVWHSEGSRRYRFVGGDAAHGRQLAILEALTSVIRDGGRTPIEKAIEYLQDNSIPRSSLLWENLFSSMPIGPERLLRVEDALADLGGERYVAAGLWTTWIAAAFRSPDTKLLNRERTESVLLHGLWWLQRAIESLKQADLSLPVVDREFSIGEGERILMSLPKTKAFDALDNAWRDYRARGWLDTGPVRLERLLKDLAIATWRAGFRAAVDAGSQGVRLGETQADLVGVWTGAFGSPPKDLLASLEKLNLSNEVESVEEADRRLALVAQMSSHDQAFAGHVVHDLKPVISALKNTSQGFTQLLGPEAGLSPDAADVVRSLQTQIEDGRRRAAEVVSVLASIAGRGRALDGDPECLRDCLEELDDVALSIDHEIAADQTVTVPRSILMFALQQILSNARKYGASVDGYRIRVHSEFSPHARFQHGEIALTFVDSGRGVPQDSVMEGGLPEPTGNVDDKDYRGLMLAQKDIRAVSGDLRFVPDPLDEKSGAYFPCLTLPAGPSLPRKRSYPTHTKPNGEEVLHG